MDDWTPQLAEPAMTEPGTGPIVEHLDPTWPYWLKWGWNGQTGQVDVWKTIGGSSDGKPYHRDVLTQLWGRQPVTFTGGIGGDADILGVAQYIPAQEKLDGTIVAPAEIKVSSRYSREVPAAVHDKLQSMFPQAAIRNARLAKVSGFVYAVDMDDDWTPSLEDEGDVLKWAWSLEDGVLIWQTDDYGNPTHEDKIRSDWGRRRSPKDVLGYAIANSEGDLEMETYGTNVKARAIQAVKNELSKLYGGANILTPEITEFDTDFGGDPGALRTASAAWAQENLGLGRVNDMLIDGKPVRSELLFPELEPLRMALEGSVSPQDASVEERGITRPPLLERGLRRVMGLPVTVAASGADKEGAMVAVFLPKEVGDKLYQKDGEPVKDMHITLAYFVDKQVDRDDWDEVERIVEQIASQHHKLTGKINGFGIFQNDVDILWAAPSVPGLAELRHEILEAVEDAGFKVSEDFGWTPHITLKYDHKGKLPKLHGSMEVEFGGLTFSKGDDHADFEFTGEFIKETAFFGGGGFFLTSDLGEGDWLPVWATAEMTWEGAQKFATDGRDVLTEPEENVGRNHDHAHPDLRAKFDSFYPDNEGIATGWIAPTADGEGFGVYSPSGGWTGLQEPGIPEIIAALDKHTGKPTHWINEYKDYLDPGQYAAAPYEDSWESRALATQ